MAAKKSGLGKGLDSLIPVSSLKNTEKKPQSDVKEQELKQDAEVLVDINKVEPNREQPRKSFDEDALRELSESIKQFGIIQPLIVYDKGKYLEIIAGERRWRAARMAGLKEIPVIIRTYSDIERMQVALIENIQREDLNPIEEALAYKKLIDEFSLKQDELAERVSKSRTAISNSMRLLKLDEQVQGMVVDGRLSTGHARALLGIGSAKEQIRLANIVVEKNLNVRQTEDMIRDTAKKPAEKKAFSEKRNAVYSDMENKLRDAVGTKVKINEKGRGKGKVEIEYYSEDDLERIYNLLMSNKNR